jgi:hypothetical protein
VCGGGEGWLLTCSILFSYCISLVEIPRNTRMSTSHSTIKLLLSTYYLLTIDLRSGTVNKIRSLDFWNFHSNGRKTVIK